MSASPNHKQAQQPRPGALEPSSSLDHKLAQQQRGGGTGGGGTPRQPAEVAGGPQAAAGSPRARARERHLCLLLLLLLPALTGLAVMLVRLRHTEAEQARMRGGLTTPGGVFNGGGLGGGPERVSAAQLGWAARLAKAEAAFDAGGGALRSYQVTAQ